MYKVYVDRALFSKEKFWKNIANNEKFEVVSYNGFSDLIVKLFSSLLYNSLVCQSGIVSRLISRVLLRGMTIGV